MGMDNTEKKLLTMVGVGVVMLIVQIMWASGVFSDKTEPDITSAHPISQQKIGDEADPDILIIYEAEVDGETVYPTVIKEAK